MRFVKFFRVARNGDSFQCFINDFYAGSIGVKDLCLLVKGKSDGKTQLLKNTGV